MFEDTIRAQCDNGNTTAIRIIAQGIAYAYAHMDGEFNMFLRAFDTERTLELIDEISALPGMGTQSAVKQWLYDNRTRLIHEQRCSDEQAAWYDEQALNLAIADEIRFWQKHALEPGRSYSVPFGKRVKGYFLGAFVFSIEYKAAWQMYVCRSMYMSPYSDYRNRLDDAAYGATPKSAYHNLDSKKRKNHAIGSFKLDTRGERIR